MATASVSSNKFCRSEDLSNEASVEAFFVLRLLADLGYEDREVKTKTAIAELEVSKGRKKEPYKPDYVLVCTNKPRWIIDAKSPGEAVDDYAYQGASYSLLINQKHEDSPVRYFMLTNGFLTRVYRWDREQPILSLQFADFIDENTKYRSLRELLGAETVRSGWASGGSPGAPVATHRIARPGMEEVKRTFYRCHRIIWKAEKVSPQAAFLRFAKILFVKLWEDRKLRDNPVYLAAIGRGDPLPADAVRFSTRWIEQQKADEENPVDRILFRQLVEALEAEIQARRRKRIFDASARLEVSPGTVKRVVEALEHQYLFGIDEDLNGRMFEAFLVATMRGQELGQYFTPRSIVKLMARLGSPVANRNKVERVLDGCCGTGGFLIEALTEMRRQVYENGALTLSERSKLLNEIANEAIFGIDAGQDPPLVKIARINMYLHGDGGSRVYLADGLRKSPAPSGADDIETRQDVEELRLALDGGENGPLRFDLVLTNPPFSMDYSMTVPEERAVLKDYGLRTWEGRERSSLRSAVMFIERYYDLLKPGGRLFTVIDDSVLGGKKNGFVRDFIRDKFIINGVISLHGDAFQRAGARTKTSVLCLTKRASQEDKQTDAFVYESRYVGLDDVTARTPASEAEKAREVAVAEINEVVAAYAEFLGGKKGPWLVKADKLTDRLDAKHLRPWSVDQLKKTWEKAGAGTDLLSNLVDPVWEETKLQADKRYTFLKISYEGYAVRGEQRLGREVSYSNVGLARPDDIVVSNISAVYRAICVYPEGMEGVLVTPEFTVLRIKDGVRVDPIYLWSVLRSSAVIAEWLSDATGVGRHRVTWDILRGQEVPLLAFDAQKKIGTLYRKAAQLHEERLMTVEEAKADLDTLDLDGEIARDRLARAKPPR